MKPTATAPVPTGVRRARARGAVVPHRIGRTPPKPRTAFRRRCSARSGRIRASGRLEPAGLAFHDRAAQGDRCPSSQGPPAGTGGRPRPGIDRRCASPRSTRGSGIDVRGLPVKQRKRSRAPLRRRQKLPGDRRGDVDQPGLGASARARGPEEAQKGVAMIYECDWHGPICRTGPGERPRRCGGDDHGQPDRHAAAHGNPEGTGPDRLREREPRRRPWRGGHATSRRGSSRPRAGSTPCAASSIDYFAGKLRDFDLPSTGRSPATSPAASSAGLPGSRTARWRATATSPWASARHAERERSATRWDRIRSRWWCHATGWSARAAPSAAMVAG